MKILVYIIIYWFDLFWVQDCKLLIWAIINENINKNNMILNVNDQNISLKLWLINKIINFLFLIFLWDNIYKILIYSYMIFIWYFEFINYLL
jgi:hypothetical protein